MALEDIVYGFSLTIGVGFALYILYILILLTNAIKGRYDEKQDDAHYQLAKKLLEELKTYGENN